jgi:hypothetical protein
MFTTSRKQEEYNMIDKTMINQIAAAYKELMIVAEEASNPSKVMDSIDKLRDSLSALAMEIDPDPRAQIRRAGGYEQWKKEVA